MFDRVARRYDVTNTVLSGGLDAVLAAGHPRGAGGPPGPDRARRRRRDGGIDGRAGGRRGDRDRVRLLPGDAARGRRRGRCRRWPATRWRCRWPTRASTASSSPSGCATWPIPDAALREFRRVTRPGGTLVICEFSSPTWAPFRTVYTEYLMRALPRIARAVSSNPEAYVYLAESIRAWPDQAALAARGAGRRLGRRRLAEPDGRHRRPAPRPPRLTAPVCTCPRHGRGMTWTGAQCRVP